LWSWVRMETNWTDHVRNEEVLYRVKETRNVLCTIKKREFNGTGHILRRNCLIKHAIVGNIEETGKWGRRRKQLLNGFKGKRGYWKLKEEALKSRSVENSPGKSLWACHNADYRMNHTFQSFNFAWNLCYIFLPSYNIFMHENFSTYYKCRHWFV
jgi:hypothetical protein